MNLVLAILALMLAPLAASAGTLRLAWTGCPGNAAAVPGVMFDCDPQAHSTYWLLSSFSLGDTVGGVVRAEGFVEIAMTSSASVPPFWHFEAGACNASQLQLVDARPGSNCAGASNMLCASGGAACDGVVTAYLVGALGGLPANHARLYFALSRSTADPVTLGPGLDYFAFGLVFSMDNASSGVCTGCTAPAAITWSEVTFLDAAGVPRERLTASDPGSQPTAYANCTGCGVVRVPARTWGVLKSLYR